MTLKTTLLAAASALVLSAGAAAAAPAVAQSDLNLRSGPGPDYGVVATIPGGATVDVGDCTGSWCAVNFGGASGFASASYLSIGGGGPSAAVVQPGYDTSDNYAYDDGYYDDYYDYGPSFGFYATPGFHHRGGFHNGGRPGWTGGRVGGDFNRGGNFAGARTGAPQVSAPAGLRTGGFGGGGGARFGGGGFGGGAHVGGGGIGGGAHMGGGGGGGQGRR